MKRKLMASLLALCMLASLIPMVPVVQAAGSNDICIWYDMGFGSVFWSKGSYNPTETADDFFCDNEHVSVNSTTQIHLLIDPDKAVDRQRWEDNQELVFMEPVDAPDRNLYVRVSYEIRNGGWYDAFVVEKGVVKQSGYTFANNILTFKAADANGFVNINVYWTDSDFDYLTFEPQDGEILVDYGWNDVEQPTLVQENVVLRDFLQQDRCRRRVIVSAATESLTFTWNGHLQHLCGDNVNHDNEWGDIENVPGNEFVLYLDGSDGPDNPRNHYDLNFDFNGDWNYLFGVNYDMNGGLVFQTVGGGTPTVTSTCFLPRQGDGRGDWPDNRSFQGENGPKTIRLLLDETRAIDWEAWDREELHFVDPWQSDDRAVSVVAKYNGTDGWHEDVLVEKGVPAPGVSFVDHVLTFTPSSGFGVDFEIYWTGDDYDFSRFDRTEDKRVLVEASWWGEGNVSLTEPLDEEDMMIRDGRMRVRVAEDVERLTFTWDQGFELRQINVEGLGENGDWLNGIQPEGNTYTLELNLTWDNGDPRDWYNIQFEFEGGGDARTVAFYDQSKGSIFWALGEDTPTADPEHYLDFGFEHGFCFKVDGARQPIHLLFDGSKGLDWDYYDHNDGAIRFVESSVPAEKRIVGVYADSDWCRGPVFWNGEVTGNGAEQGVSYENGVLTFQPGNSSDLMLHVYWTQADADFDGFQGTEECPVIVEYRWRNQGEIPVPEGVSEENYIIHEDGGSARIRLPIDQKSITFTWAEEYGVHRIGYSVRSEDGEEWMDFEVDQSQPHSFTLELNQTEWMDGRVEPCTWYQVEFEFYDDSRYQVWINWKASEGNVYFGLNEAPPPVEDPETYDLGRYYVSYGDWTPSSLTVDEQGNESIGTVYLRLDPAHSVDYFGEEISLHDLPEYDYSPTIYMEYPLEGALGEWFEGPVVVDGQAVSDFVTFADNVLSFTPINEQPVIVHIFWSQADEALWNFDTTDEKPIMVELMLGGRVPVELPADIQPEDIQVWHAAEHDYVRVRVPAQRENLELTWAREGIVSLIEVDGAGENGDPLRVNFPAGKSYVLELNQEGWNGGPKEFYGINFWGFDWAENPFRDVPENAWYHEAIRFAVSMGITVGTSEGSFSPDRPMTRAEFVTFLWRLCGSPEPESAVCGFTDVPAKAWYRNAVLCAVEQGITCGTSAAAFSPDARCTRAQVVTMIWRAVGSPEPESSANPFTDVADDAWYATAVRWAVEQGITAGTSQTTFSPGSACTRAMGAMFLYRCMLNAWREEE